MKNIMVAAQAEDRDAENVPLLVPILMGAGIGAYFSLPREPSMYLAAALVAAGALLLLFARAGNSSEKVVKYKRRVAASTARYALKKIFKLALFALLFPLLGQFALFLLVFDFIMRLLSYSKFLGYFAFLYDNAMMKPVWRYMKKTFVGRYSRDVVKASHAKRGATRKMLRLMANRTRAAYRRIDALLFGNRTMVEMARLWKKFAPSAIGAASILGAALFFASLGFFAATYRTARLGTNLLQSRISDAAIEGRVRGVEPVGGDLRVTLDELKVEGKVGARAKLDGVRIRFKSEFGSPEVGSRIALSATLLPPFEPATAEGFNYALYSYFHGLSASGRAFAPWRYAEVQPEPSGLDRVRFGLLNMRSGINGRLLEHAEGPAGGVLISMTTGDIYAMDKRVSEDYRAAGISHMISISGLHMTLVAGLVFFLVRLLFAMVPPIAARFDTKKIAIPFAFAAGLFYLMLSGARVAAQRAFIMTGLGLLAVLLDKSPLSMRFVAASAIAILALTPEAVTNPGFQMSFMADAALIRIYEMRDKWIARPKGKSFASRMRAGISNAFRANLIVNAVISAAITPFVIYSFNTLQIYGIFGNLVALPIFSFVVMPFAMLALAAMPFGLDAPFTRIAAFGADMINGWARAVSGLPYSSIAMKSMDTPALALITLGFVWLFLWRERRRYLGLAAVALGCAIYAAAPASSVYADGYGTLFGISERPYLRVLNMSKYRPNSKTVSEWKNASALESIIPTEEKSFVINGTRVALVDRYSDYGDACRKADVVFAAFDVSKAYYKCPKQVFGREFFSGTGGAQFYIKDGKASFRTIGDSVGERP
ncbi:MAG: ComEC/Rec2 family competence protein, partial [Rickettsiales bacterium]|nr:ComEC/Rec2 family competence protein [Rickettsiales bacterium]